MNIIIAIFYLLVVGPALIVSGAIYGIGELYGVRTLLDNSEILFTSSGSSFVPIPNILGLIISLGFYILLGVYLVKINKLIRSSQKGNRWLVIKKWIVMPVVWFIIFIFAVIFCGALVTMATDYFYPAQSLIVEPAYF